MTHNIKIKKTNTLKFAELILLVLVWVVLIAAPVFLMEINLWNGRIFKSHGNYYSLIFIFLINRFILVPKLLFNKRRLSYLISVAGLIAVFSLGSLFSLPNL